jgi:hypothetical protein
MIMDEDEQIEQLVEHLEQVITTLTDRIDRLEHNTPAPLTLSPPMQVHVPNQPLGFYNCMAPMNPS